MKMNIKRLKLKQNAAWRLDASLFLWGLNQVNDYLQRAFFQLVSLVVQNHPTREQETHTMGD